MPAVVGETVSRLGASERSYLSGTFAELCRIESHSGRERECAERIQAELRALGVPVQEDDAARDAGSECGNLLARLSTSSHSSAGRFSHGGREEHDPSSGSGSILLCAHMDTVPLQAPVAPVLHEGIWENANDGILGADNKAAIAVLLALARHVCLRGGPQLDVELLFTVCEEQALAGARAFDRSCLQSEFGYVFDHSTPIGEMVLGSPSHFRLEAVFQGVAAHAGVRPQEGRSAILAAAHAIAGMPHGRLDERTTVNVGTILGGSATNVVAERCSLVAEVRSLDDERAETVIAQIVDRAHEAANLAECECDLDVSVQRTFSGYQLARGATVVRVAERALQACGHEPSAIITGGASDANALIASGLPVLNLANGTERNHEPGERVSVAALEGMLEVALALMDEAARPSPNQTVEAANVRTAQAANESTVESPC